MKNLNMRPRAALALLGSALGALGCAVTITLALSAAAPVHAADVVVRVQGVPPGATGEVGCGLFDAAATFPDGAAGRMSWHSAQPGTVTCVFTGVADGSYALSVLHDLNNNRRLDTNALGIPREAWGVSNNVRPTLRPPRFDEARFVVEGGRDLTLDIRVAR